jgi:hypothetical protein
MMGDPMNPVEDGVAASTRLPYDKSVLINLPPGQADGKNAYGNEGGASAFVASFASANSWGPS